MAAKKTIDAEIRSGYFEGRGGIKGKKGEIVQIPADEKSQSPATRQALRTGKLRAIQATADLAPVTSEETPKPE